MGHARSFSVLLLLLIAVILALGLLPYVNDLVRVGIPRPLAIVALMLAILVVFSATVAYLVPAVVSEAQQIQENLPSYAGKIDQQLSHLGVTVRLEENVHSIHWSDYVSASTGVAYGVRVVTLIVSVVTVLILTAYVLADAPRIGKREVIDVDVEQDRTIERRRRAESAGSNARIRLPHLPLHEPAAVRGSLPDGLAGC